MNTFYVNEKSCEFSVNKNGFLAAKVDGKEYRRVLLSRALPLTQPDKYICITDMEQNELGIIEDISAFSGQQRELIEKELSTRYFCPVITQVQSVKEKMGHFYFEVLIGEYKKTFAVKDVSKSIRQTGGAIDITDVDGNRYRIEDLSKINTKSRRMIEPYLY